MLQMMCIVELGGLAADYNHWKRFPDAKPDEVPEGHSADEAHVRGHLRKLRQVAEADYQAYLEPNPIILYRPDNHRI